MFDRGEIRRLREAVAAYAAGFDPALVSPAQAAVVVDEAARIEKMAATVTSLAAARAAEADALGEGGEASAAVALARRTGTTVGRAGAALRTGRALAAQPALAAAARRGELSADQAAAISEAAAAAPGAEAALVERARAASLAELRTECERAKAAADADAEARHRRVHAARYARRRSCPDGSAEIVYRSTRPDVAEAWAVIAGFATAAFDRARRAGRRQPSQAYAADGLLDMARAAAAGARRPAPHPAGPGGPAAGVAGGAVAGAGAEAGVLSGGAAAAGAQASPGPAGPAGTEDKAVAGAETPGAADGAAAADTEHGTAGPTGTGRPHGGTAAGDGNGEVERGRAAAPVSAGPAADAPAAPAPPPPPPAPARSPVPTKVVVRIDWTALVRGWVAEGETCEITGLGPAAVSAVRAMMASGDPFLAAVVTKGVDVVSVAHLGRRPSAFQQTALDWLAPTCRVEGCDAAGRLEYDHRHDWAATHLTALDGIDPLCAGHHDRTTYDGWALVAGTGKRPMVAPDDPRHPGHARASPVPGRAPG